MRKVLQRCLICISCLSLVLLLLQYRGVVLPERDGSGSFDLHLHKYSVEESQSLRLRNDTEEGIRQACKSVIDGDRKTIKTLRQSNAFPWRDTTTDEQVSKIARNCTALKMRYGVPYFTHEQFQDFLGFTGHRPVLSNYANSLNTRLLQAINLVSWRSTNYCFLSRFSSTCGFWKVRSSSCSSRCALQKLRCRTTKNISSFCVNCSTGVLFSFSSIEVRCIWSR